MDSLSDTENLLIVLGVVIIIFGAIWIMDRRVKRDGNLFAKPPTIKMRLFAGLLGLVFGIVFIYELADSSSIHFMFPLAAFALIAYSFGATDLLIAIQGGKTKSPLAVDQNNSRPVSPVANQILRLLLILGIGLVVIVLVIYGGAWILAHEESFLPLLALLGLAIVCLVPLRALLFLFELFRAVKKSDPPKHDL